MHICWMKLDIIPVSTVEKNWALKNELKVTHLESAWKWVEI